MIKRIFSLLLTLIMTVSCFAVAGISTASAESEPELTTKNYFVYITNANDLMYLRFAPGVYTTANQIKNAEGVVTLNGNKIAENTVNGTFSYEMAKGGIYSFWVKYKTTGKQYIFSAVDMTVMTPEVSVEGVTLTVSSLYNVSDLFIAKGKHTSYQEIKNNGYIVRVTSNKLDYVKEYSYNVGVEGDYTVFVRFKDGRTPWYEHIAVDCVNPEFKVNGLQVTVSNIEDAKCIRTAYGNYSTISGIKLAKTHRAFVNVIRGKSAYTIQYRDEGEITVVVQYNNGYYEFFHHDLSQNTPTYSVDQNVVTFGNLEALKLIRYAKGSYSTSADIKYAPGSVVIKPDAINEKGEIVIELEPGTYSFCVQYEDESYNFYTFDLETKGGFTQQCHNTYNSKGQISSTLPYWLYTPDNATRNMPLIVVLHSAMVKLDTSLSNEENLNNLVSAKDDIPKYFYEEKFGDVPAYIIMPQTSGSSRGWAKRGSEIVALIDFMAEKYRIDTSNVSAIGFSLGGTGAMELAAAYPEAFDRVISVAGGLDGVTNNNRPFVNGERMDISAYPELCVLKSGSSTEYEKETMKYLYAAEGNKYKTDSPQAYSFKDMRLGNTANAMNSSEVKLWAIVGSKDVEVEHSVSVDLCAMVNNAKCDAITGYSHAKALTHCLEITEEIIEFLIG